MELIVYLCTHCPLINCLFDIWNTDFLDGKIDEADEN